MNFKLYGELNVSISLTSSACQRQTSPGLDTQDTAELLSGSKNCSNLQQFCPAITHGAALIASVRHFATG